MTESITTPHALVQTSNGKRFYVNSGLVIVAAAETAVIDIANIGERDIKFILNPILTFQENDHMTMRVKNNDIIIYESIYDNTFNTTWFLPIHFIIPANTNLEITFTNSDSSSRTVGVSCYGKFLSM